MIYVASDLHGYPLDRFMKLLNSTGFNKDDTLYILGDVIDRGFEGVKILQWIMKQDNVEFILGNHELMLMDSELIFNEKQEYPLVPDDDFTFFNWMGNGGKTTFSDMQKLNKKEFHEIMSFLGGAPLYKEISINDKTYILVHSGLSDFSDDKPLYDYSQYDLVWTRPTLDTQYYKDKTVVFGHTPTFYYGNEYKGKILKRETWIDIDAGAAAGLSPAVLRLDDLKEFYM